MEIEKQPNQKMQKKTTFFAAFFAHLFSFEQVVALFISVFALVFICYFLSQGNDFTNPSSLFAPVLYLVFLLFSLTFAGILDVKYQTDNREPVTLFHEKKLQKVYFYLSLGGVILALAIFLVKVLNIYVINKGAGDVNHSLYLALNNSYLLALSFLPAAMLFLTSLFRYLSHDHKEIFLPKVVNSFYYLATLLMGEIVLLIATYSFSFPPVLSGNHLAIINLVLALLPAIALSGKEKTMSEQSLYQTAELWKIILGGFFLALTSFAGYLLLPYLRSNGSDLNIILKADGYSAFVSLAEQGGFLTFVFASIWYALSFPNTSRSFLFAFKKENRFLLFALCGEIALLILLWLVPYLNTLFGLGNSLTVSEVFMVLGLSIIPLFLHEIKLVILRIENKINKKEK